MKQFAIERASSIRTALAFVLLYGVLSAAASADLIAVNGGNLTLISIDPSTGEGNRVGQLDPSEPNIRGLTYDMTNDIVYGIYPGGTLVTIDLAAETTSVIGAMSDIRTRGLAFDPNSEILYSARTGGTQLLLAYDTTTGMDWVVGPMEHNANGLVYHPGLGLLLSADSSSDQLISIDPQTGAGSVIGSFGPFGNISSLAYDPTSDRLFGTDVVTDELYQIDPSTGAATFIGNIGFNDVDNLTYIPAPGAIVLLAIGCFRCKRNRT